MQTRRQQSTQKFKLNGPPLKSLEGGVKINVQTMDENQKKFASLPYIYLNIDENKLRIMYVTGSELSFLNPDIIDRLCKSGHEIKQNKLIIKGVTGDKAQI